MATIKGSHLFSYQKDAVDEALSDDGTNKKVVILARRQCGKSLTICNLLLYVAINRAGSRSILLSPTFKQAKRIYKSISKAMGRTRGIVKSLNGSDLAITFSNGSEIQMLSGEQGENLRGYSVSKGGIFCIDEAAYVKESTYTTTLPYTDFSKATCVYVSTPFIADGFFYRHYLFGLEHEHNTVTIEWKRTNPKYQEDLDRILSPEQLAEYKAILPKNVFLTEYEAEFISGTGMVFDGFKDVVQFNEIKPTDKLYVGIDWSNQKNDYSALSVFNGDGKQVMLWYANDMKPLAQIEQIYLQLEPYLRQIVAIVCETNSLGTPYTEMLKEKMPLGHKECIKEFTTTNASKADLVGRLQLAFDSKSITLLDDEEQIREFGYFSCEVTANKNVVYNAPAGLHDDLVLCTGFALFSLQQYRNNGMYCLGSARTARR